MRVSVFGADVADDRPTTAERSTSGIRWIRRAMAGSTSGSLPGSSFADRYGTDGSGSLLAGRLLALASLVPALLVTAWVVAGFPLAAVGRFTPALVVPAFVVAAAILVPLGLSLLRHSAATLRGPWWSAAGVGVVAAGFTVFAALTHSSHVIVRRDAGSYAQIAYLLAHQAGLSVFAPVSAYGNFPGLIGFASPAFYFHQQAGTITPQFMTGWPEVLAGADWAGGWTGLLLTPAVIGGCAILAFGGLAARLLGPRWAPLAALLAACAWPILRASQETLSEPLALLTLAASGCLLIDWMLAGRRAGAGGMDAGDDALRGRIDRSAFALGLVLSASELVRLDFGVDFAFVLPILGWLVLTKRPGVLMFLSGAVIGGGLGVLDGVFVGPTYVANNWSAVRLMLALLVGIAVAVVVAVLLVRSQRHRSPLDFRWWRWVPLIGAGLLALVEIGLFIRPWVLIDHSTTDHTVIDYVQMMQRGLGLPIDGTRGYAELSLRWVAWYVGWAMVLAAGVGAVCLTWRVLRGRDLRWLPILAMFLCSAILVLLRPSITPDHPWADRRLVVEVLPVVVLLATWTTAALTGWVRRRWPIRWLPSAVVTVVVICYLVPMGVALTPVAVQRTEQGEPAMIARVCAALSPQDVVVEVDQVWMPVIRDQCGLPVAQLVHPSFGSVLRVANSIRENGRTPVVVGSQEDDPVTFGLFAHITLTLDTREDARQLVYRPDSTVPLTLRFWLATP